MKKRILLYALLLCCAALSAFATIEPDDMMLNLSDAPRAHPVF
jgi:hypothetical protein